MVMSTVGVRKGQDPEPMLYSMKQTVCIITLFGLILVAALGFTIMGHTDGPPHSYMSGEGEQGSVHRGCIASEAQGMTCPATGSPFDTAIFHLDVLKSITMGVLPISAMLGLLAGFLGAFLLSLIALAGPPYGWAPSRFGFIPAVRSPVPRARIRLVAWLTLYEKRDPALAL